MRTWLNRLANYPIPGLGKKLDLGIHLLILLNLVVDILQVWLNPKLKFD